MIEYKFYIISFILCSFADADAAVGLGLDGKLW
jgi:hypothetical protein